MKNVPKEEQKQHLIDMMKGDEELGLYEESKQENTMKTPKEKAKELVNDFINFQNDIEWGNEDLNHEMEVLYNKNENEYEIYWKQLSKLSSLKVVNEVLTLLNLYHDQDCKINNTKIAYYEEVKQEIEKL
jgi:hypothetical protein